MEEEKIKRKHKGVSTKDSKRSNIYFSDTDSCTAPSRSISRVKNELQTVIDLMGPDTPLLHLSTSNEADNEESVFSSTSIKFSNKSDEAAIVSHDSGNNSDKTMPPDITFEEETDCSMIVDQNSTYIDTTNQDYSQYICPPPLLPANVMYNSECMCPQIASFIHKETMSMPCIRGERKEKKSESHKTLFHSWFKNFKGKQNSSAPGEYYTINMKQSRDNQSLPRRLIFDLVGDIPKRDECLFKQEEFKESYFVQTCEEVKSKESKNFNNEQLTKESHRNEIKAPLISKEDFVSNDKNGRKFHQKTTYSDDNGTTRVDVYYFDHGNSSYLKTTDSPPMIMAEALAEKTEVYTTKFWAEVFGTVHIGTAFCTSFILQLFRFILYSVFRPLTIGMIQLFSDYLFKPFIATVFNAIIQPPLLFLYNVGTSLRDLCDPLAEGIGYFLREIAVIFRAIRIVEIRKDKCADNARKGDNRTITCET